MCMLVLRWIGMGAQEFEPAVELLKEATFKLAQVLGKGHPDTQMMMARLNEVARAAGMTPGGRPAASPSPAPAPATAAPVAATVSGLVSAAELNGCAAVSGQSALPRSTDNTRPARLIETLRSGRFGQEVLSWVKTKGRYQCRVSKHDGSSTIAAIKPGNLLLPTGTVVTVCGVTSVSTHHAAWPCPCKCPACLSDGLGLLIG
jgi:hypothetical protein